MREEGAVERAGVLVIGGELAEAGRGAGSALGRPVRVASTLGEGLRALGEGRWGATVLSLDLPGSGLALAGRVAGEGRAGAVVLASAEPTPELVMEAVRGGAVALLGIPVEAEALAEVLRGVTAEGGRVPLPPAGEGELIGRSARLMEVFGTVARVAPSAATVLITGESGTGKELVARAIHGASGRSRGAFVAVNCAAIPEDLLESELFGHERGAFTGAIARKLGRFERAAGGTLFLDEIGDMSLVLQAKILRALQEREIERLGGEERIPVDVRVVAATHRDLAERIARGEFREDLFYRLAVVRLHLPPLRERGADVRALALHYAARYAAEYGGRVRFIATAALERLEGHEWPGNVRELRNVVERAVLTAPGDTVRVEEVELDRPRRAAVSGATLPGYHPRLSMAEVEKLHIARVLEEEKGHLGRAAEVLGMHRNTVSRKAQEYGIVGER
jgi:DNA-binding NtrC family response regulator